MSSLSNSQLPLGFRQAPALPFAVSPRRLRRAVRRALGTVPAKFGAVGYLEDVAMMRQLRTEYSRALLQEGGAARFATTPRGRRAHRLFERMANRIVTEHASLCG